MAEQTIAPTVKPMLSILDFDATKKCENQFTFPFINEHGEETTFLITVIGDQAPKVKEAIYKRLNKERMQNAMLEKRGKDIPLKPVEDLMNDGYEGVATCIVGWSGVAEPYSHETAVQLVRNNKLIFDQVKSASENLANFTSSK